MKSASELQAELSSFKNIWQGGFFTCDPADPIRGLWGLTSFIGVSHAIYLACVRPNLTPSTNVLEIGCGRGAWAKLMLDAREICCLDALGSRRHARCWRALDLRSFRPTWASTIAVR
jgi:hypothetical protein